MDLFDQPNAYRPLADRLRAKNLDEYVGQQHLLAKGTPLRRAIEQGQLHSMILWGPPGVGKTTLARLFAHVCEAKFLTLSAVLSGVKEIREAVQQAKNYQQMGQKTILFVDEVHRFNKSQQDAFLPHVEDGTFIFIGATTENPSFSLNNALLSRARIYLLKSLDEQALHQLQIRALSVVAKDYACLIEIESAAAHAINASADGDGRRFINLLETGFSFTEEVNGKRILKNEDIKQILAHAVRRFDNKGDIFYDQISALHKSIRGSNPDAALYWCAKMIDGGCDPLYVARRCVAIASEDVGNADPRAMEVALNAWDAFERVGPAEGERAIAQAVVYLACAPKSNAVYTAWKQALAMVREEKETTEVPNHLRNAPTQLMKSLEYGKAYRYAHDEPDAYAAGENYFPTHLSRPQFYFPTDRGLERKIKEKLDYLRHLDEMSERQ